MADITIYTDGSCCNATGNKGGYGIVLINGTVKQFSGGSFINTTSSRMELKAIVEALKKCHSGDDVTVYSDNQYAVHTIKNKWIFRWEKQQWQGRKNADLLQELLSEYRRLRQNVKLKWVKGHSNNEYNILADALANLGANRQVTIKDKSISKASQLIRDNSKWQINNKGKIIPKI